MPLLPGPANGAQPSFLIHNPALVDIRIDALRRRRHLLLPLPPRSKGRRPGVEGAIKGRHRRV